MPEKTKIFFISPKTNFRHFSPPLNLASLAAVAREKGCDIRIMDFSARYANYSEGDLLSEMKSFQPDIVCVPINTIFARQAFRVAELLNGSNSLKVAGGPHPTVVPHESLERGFDVVVRGEGEKSLSDLIDYSRGEKSIKDIPGISHKVGNNFIDNPPRKPIMNLDEIPFPAIELFNEGDYAGTKNDFRDFGIISSSRGCPYGCIFCAVSSTSGKAFRFRSAEQMVAEIEKLIAGYGINYVVFLDDIFTFNRERVMEFCRLVIEKELKVKWECSTRVDAVDADLLVTMAAAGCASITYGFESGDENTLKRIGKGISTEQMKTALKLTTESGIKANANFVLGFPWEIAETAAITRKFMREISSKVSIFIPSYTLMPFPGTKIFEEFKQSNGFDNWWNTEGEEKYFVEAEDTPVFHKIFYSHPHLLFDVFFKYSPEVKKEFLRTIDFIIRHNLRQDSNIFKLFGGLFLYNLSKTLFSISPKLELSFFNLVRAIKNLPLSLKVRD